MISIGALRHRFTLQSEVLVPNGTGGFLQTWRDLTDTPHIIAAVNSLGVETIFEDQRQVERVTHRLFVRWRPDIRPGMRMVRGAEIYSILTVLDREDTKKWLELMTRREE